jgi:hypothetical protein
LQSEGYHLVNLLILIPWKYDKSPDHVELASIFTLNFML